MTDREKLIALMRQVGACICDLCDGGEEPFNHSAGILADHLLANGVVVREWIPVTERLPEADAGDVLVVKNYRGKTHVDIGEIIEGEAYCYSDDYAIHPREHKLTHWMPLPEPPADMRKESKA